MISLFLKHKLFEVCIDKVFTSLQNNFNNVPDISIGNRFKRITIVDYGLDGTPNYKSYDNCEIKDVYSSHYLGEAVTLFNFITDEDDLILACDLTAVKFDR